jgi:hypothetical protein
MPLRLAVPGLCLLIAGCAVTQPARRDQRIHELAGRYVYDRPIENVWPKARQLLVDAGYALQESPDDYQLVTDWHDVLSGSLAKVWVRYLVWGERLDGERCIVRFARSEINYLPNELRDTISTSGDSIYQRNPLKDSTPLGLKLRFKKNEGRAESGTTQIGGRDLIMEWELLKRLEPEIARRIEQLAARN